MAPLALPFMGSAQGGRRDVTPQSRLSLTITHMGVAWKNRLKKLLCPPNPPQPSERGGALAFLG